MTTCTLLADPEDVFGRRVQCDDEQVFIEQDHARAQGVENMIGVSVQRSVIPGTGAA